LELGYWWRWRLTVRDYTVHVVTLYLMFRAIPALRIRLIATNVSSLACLAAFAGFCVAAAGWTTTRSSHLDEELGKSVGDSINDGRQKE